MRVSVIAGSDIEPASEILIEAAQWLAVRGDPLWRESELRPDALLCRYSPDDIHLGWHDGEAIAVLVLQWSDPIFWPGVAAGSSGFIHKLAVRRAWAGKGIARKMVEWAARRCRERDADYLRLDCSADRPRLCSFYEQIGFRLVGRRMIESYDTALYELGLNTL